VEANHNQSTSEMKNFSVAFGVALLALIAAVGAQNPCQNIRTRSQWGARAATTANLPIQPAAFFVVHHTAGALCTTQAECDAQMRGIQNFHMNSNGWADIGYNFCVGNTGQIYEGRGFGRQGAHSPSYNNQSIGFCFIGTFGNMLPTIQALTNAQAFVQCARDMGRLRSDYWVITHRQDIATSCPGDSLNNHVRGWARWNSAPRPL